MMIGRELRSEIRAQRAVAAVEHDRAVPGSVPFIRSLLAEEADPLQRDDLLGELAGEYLRAGLEDEHLLVQRERVRNHPDAAILWLGLAHSLSLRSDGAEEAKVAAATGLARAREAGALIRDALVCQAEVARQTNDQQLFEEAIRLLIEDADNHRETDCGLPEHLVDGMLPDFCSPQLQTEYRKLL